VDVTSGTTVVAAGLGVDAAGAEVVAAEVVGANVAPAPVTVPLDDPQPATNETVIPTPAQIRLSIRMSFGAPVVNPLGILG
jgi:hypothetical protein